MPDILQNSVQLLSEEGSPVNASKAVSEDSEESEVKKIPTSVHMQAIIQADYHDQMEVFRWLQHDTQYRVYWILHDRDICVEDYERKSGQTGEIQKIKKGDMIPPHYHLYIRLSKKLAAKTLSKRFGNYVHFMICKDPYEWTRYLTHETFQAHKDGKTVYKRSEVRGDTSLYWEYMREASGVDTIDCCTRFLDAVQRCDGDEREAVISLIASRDVDVIRSMMSHSYFYSRFLCKREDK